MRSTLRALAGLVFSSALVVACASAPPTTSVPSPSAATTQSQGHSDPPSGAPPATSQAISVGTFPDMPFYRADPARTAVQPGPGPTTAPVQAWQTPLGHTHFLPILVDGLIIGGSDAGEVVAVDAATGGERWRFQADGPVGQSAAAAGGLVFFGDTHSVFAVDAMTGIQRWIADVPSTETRPIVVDGVVYTSSIGGVVGLDAGTGRPVWQWHGPDGVSATVGPVVDGVAYIGAGDGRLYAIDLKTSGERWHVQTISQTLGVAEVVGDSVYVATTNDASANPVGELYAIDRASGAIRWRFRTPSGFQVSAGPVRDGILYSNSLHDGLYALRDDGSTATPVWHVETPGSFWPNAIVGDTVYEQRADGSIGAYATSDGHLVWATPSLQEEAGGPLVSGGMVFQVQDTHGFTAFAAPELVAQLPSAAPPAVASPSASAVAAKGPFEPLGAYPLSDLGIAVPLAMAAGPDGLLYVLDSTPSVVVVDPDTGKIVRTWGRAGAGPGEFDLSRADDNPGNGDIAVAGDGTVYVADGSNHRVQAFKPNGTFLRQFGSFGAGPGEFGDVQEVVVAPDGSVYVMDDQAAPLSKFSAAGKFRWRMPLDPAAPEAGHVPHGVAVRPDGSLLLSCEDCGHLLVLDPKDGKVVQRLADVDQLVSAGYLELGPDGRIYVAQFYPVSEVVLDADGSFLDEQVHVEGAPETVLSKTIAHGDVLWPAPVFLPDGRAFTFGPDGLTEIKVTLPS